MTGIQALLKKNRFNNDFFGLVFVHWILFRTKALWFSDEEKDWFPYINYRIIIHIYLYKKVHNRKKPGYFNSTWSKTAEKVNMRAICYESVPNLTSMFT